MKGRAVEDSKPFTPSIAAPLQKGEVSGLIQVNTHKYMPTCIQMQPISYNRCFFVCLFFSCFQNETVFQLIFLKKRRKIFALNLFHQGAFEIVVAACASIIHLWLVVSFCRICFYHVWLCIDIAISCVTLQSTCYASNIKSFCLDKISKEFSAGYLQQIMYICLPDVKALR